jgi:hypothetical protein
MSAEQLEERFDQAVKDMNLNAFEIAGMQTRPNLALKAGMAIGYKMRLQDASIVLEQKGKV